MSYFRSIITAIILACTIPVAGRAATVSRINTAQTQQRCDGWGVSLCWWAKMCGQWEDEKIDELVDWLTSPDGLNLNVFRYNIGGGDDPNWTNCRPHHMAWGKGVRAEMEGFLDSPDGVYHWERDEGQRKIMLKIKERRPDAIFEAFSNSPPWWMTVSGCVAGASDANADNLRPECYGAFADYLLTVCRHYKDTYGIVFHTLEPFNEPVTDYWKMSGGQEGCHVSTTAQIAFLKVLQPKLEASGLTTLIASSDETSVEQSVRDFNVYASDGDALRIVGQWNVHTYSADNRSRKELHRLADRHAKPLWMSEVGVGGRGIDGSIALAQRIIDDERLLQPSVWCYWQYVEDIASWALVRGNYKTHTYGKVKNYYAVQHFSRFIKAGYTILATTDSHTLAALSPDARQMVIIVTNATDNQQVHRFDIEGFTYSKAETYRTTRAENLALIAEPLTGNSITIPPKSITTVVLEGMGL